MTEPHEEYLGDGLYAQVEGGIIRLRAPRGFGVDHVVYLDEFVLEAFEQFVKRHREKVFTQ
jgi:hypothetical protein